MGRLIDIVTGKQNGSVVLGKRQDRNVVTGRPTLALRALEAARSLLAGLAGSAGTRFVAMRHCHAAAVTLGATPALESKGSRATMRWPRWPSRPGYPRGGDRG
jgi:hypothetical protein